MDILRMTGIWKSFYGVTVLKNVDFSVRQGEVHALLGENGAGKSTLMNILGGVHHRDAGRVVFFDQTLDQITVKSSENAGIAFVHQELNLFNDLKVYENIFLRKEITNALGVLNKKEMIRQTARLFDSLGVDIDPCAMVSTLDTSKKQLLEIAKALHANAKLFILDEPTTSLNQHEIDHLFDLIRRLAVSGKSFIFISHKMNEIFCLADRYTVLRNGELVATGNIADTTPAEITRQMVGNQFSEKGYYEPRQLREDILVLDRLNGPGFYDINLCVKKGEVVGFTGLKGSGISEMMQAIFGALPVESGSIVVKGKQLLDHSIADAMRTGIAMIPANRKENSVVPDATNVENMQISRHAMTSRSQVIHKKHEIVRFDDLRHRLNIKVESPDGMLTALSGGNQQKVILARWLNTDADILLMDNPTQGIDVGAKAEIYALIQQMAQAGKTILVNTLEIPEIQKVADRCIVFFHGRIQAEFVRQEITEEKVMLSATNAINALEVVENHG